MMKANIQLEFEQKDIEDLEQTLAEALKKGQLKQTMKKEDIARVLAIEDPALKAVAIKSIAETMISSLLTTTKFINEVVPDDTVIEKLEFR